MGFLYIVYVLMNCFGYGTTFEDYGSQVEVSGREINLETIAIESLQKFNVPGIAVGVIKDDKVFFSCGFGLRNVDAGLPVTENTLFGIASCTKAFTTLILGQLVDEGLISWDDPVLAYIPEFRLFTPQLTQTVTIRDLVAHRTGIPRNDAIWFCWNVGKLDILNRIAHLEPIYSLREKWHYNNFMYAVAGMVIERVTGESWEEAIASRLFIPLGMSNSNLCIEQSQSTEDFALPFAEIDGNLKAISFRGLSVVSPGGAINSNIEDMLRWVHFQLSTGKLGDKRIVQKKTLKEMHTSQISASEREEIGFSQQGYGLGWFIGSYKGHEMINHSGLIDGFVSEVVLLPQEKLGIVILTNSSTDGRYAVSSIRNTLLDFWLGEVSDDWFAIVGAKRAEEKKGLFLEKNDENTPPPRPLTDYVGIYENPSYGRVRIDIEKQRLCAFCGNLVFPLEYQKDELFQAHIRELLVYGMRRITDFVFFKDPAGVLNRVEISFEPAAKPVVFRRIHPMAFDMDQKGKCRIDKVSCD